jgi:tetratricopeptide (TPR) repeat protein
MSKLATFIAVYFLTNICFAQTYTARLNHLDTIIYNLDDKGKNDSVMYYLLNFGSLPDLSVFEKQYLYDYLGFEYINKNDKQKGITNLKKSITFSTPQEDSQNQLGVTYHTLSNAYFTFHDYDSAFVYANMALKIVHIDAPKFYFDMESILGYYYFVKLKSDSSLAHYSKALKAAEPINDYCLKASILNKMARTYSQKGDLKKALLLIDSCNNIHNFSCKNLELKINTQHALFEILKEHKQFEKALKVDAIIDSLSKIYDAEDRNKALDAAEIKFKSKLKEKENFDLKEISIQKENVLYKQKIALIISLLAIVMFITLSYFLFKISRQRKKLISN